MQGKRNMTVTLGPPDNTVQWGSGSQRGNVSRPFSAAVRGSGRNVLVGASWEVTGASAEASCRPGAPPTAHKCAEKGRGACSCGAQGPESELPCKEKTQSTAERDRASETGSPLFRAGRRVRPGLRAAQGKEPQVLPRHCSVQLGVEGKARAPHP